LCDEREGLGWKGVRAKQTLTEGDRVLERGRTAAEGGGKKARQVVV